MTWREFQDSFSPAAPQPYTPSFIAQPQSQPTYQTPIYPPVTHEEEEPEVIRRVRFYTLRRPSPQLTWFTENGARSKRSQSKNATKHLLRSGKKRSQKPSARSMTFIKSTIRKPSATSARTSAFESPFVRCHLLTLSRCPRECRESEAEFFANLESSLSTGTTWARICEIIELQNSQSKTIARSGAGTTDLTRFKEVLLRLKREGDAAPGAAGY